MINLRTPENAEIICTRIAEGRTLREIADEIDCVASAITNWRRTDAEFRALYKAAKIQQAEKFAEELLEIADDSRNDWIERRMADGTIVRELDKEHIQRSRVRIDTRKWLMAKYAPKVYGDRIGIDGNMTLNLEQLVLRSLGQIAAPTIIEHDDDE